MQQLLGLVRIHEEVLQQNLSLRQVLRVELLVDQGLILGIPLFVLHRSERSVTLCLSDSLFFLSLVQQNCSDFTSTITCFSACLSLKNLEVLLSHVLFGWCF